MNSRQLFILFQSATFSKESRIFLPLLCHNRRLCGIHVYISDEQWRVWVRMRLAAGHGCGAANRPCILSYPSVRLSVIMSLEGHPELCGYNARSLDPIAPP